MKVKSLAVGMIVPLAASVALATAPTASAATPTKAAFTHSGVSAHSRGHSHGYGHYGYGHYGYGWYNGWGTNEARYHPYYSDLYGGVGPVVGSWKRCKIWGFSFKDELRIPC